MAQNINKLKLIKEEFKNLVTIKIITIHEFSGNKLKLQFQIRLSKMKYYEWSDSNKNFRAIGEDFTVRFSKQSRLTV